MKFPVNAESVVHSFDFQIAAAADPPFKKQVTLRLDPERGVKVLTWGAGGQAYVLVSGLPGRGTEACFICHATPERRKLIRETPLKPKT